MHHNKEHEADKDRMNDVLVEEMENQNVVRTEDNMGERMDVGMNPEETMREDMDMNPEEGMPEMPDEAGENLHDSQSYGDTDTIDVSDEISALGAEENLANDGDEYSPESLEGMGQDERHEMQQEANNIAQNNDDELAKLHGDRRGLRQDS